MLDTSLPPSLLTERDWQLCWGQKARQTKGERLCIWVGSAVLCHARGLHFLVIAGWRTGMAALVGNREEKENVFWGAASKALVVVD